MVRFSLAPGSVRGSLIHIYTATCSPWELRLAEESHFRDEDEDEDEEEPPGKNTPRDPWEQDEMCPSTPQSIHFC